MQARVAECRCALIVSRQAWGSIHSSQRVPCAESAMSAVADIFHGWINPRSAHVNDTQIHVALCPRYARWAEDPWLRSFRRMTQAQKGETKSKKKENIPRNRVGLPRAQAACSRQYTQQALCTNATSYRECAGDKGAVREKISRTKKSKKGGTLYTRTHGRASSVMIGKQDHAFTWPARDAVLPLVCIGAGVAPKKGAVAGPLFATLRHQRLHAFSGREGNGGHCSGGN